MPITYRARFVFFGSGYFNYDEGYLPDFPGAEHFGGVIVHPQHWPEDLNYAGKKIVVIGSGATAVSLIPSLTEKAAKVTMLQRSPTYLMASSKYGTFAAVCRKLFPRQRRAPGRPGLQRAHRSGVLVLVTQAAAIRQMADPHPGGPEPAARL